MQAPTLFHTAGTKGKEIGPNFYDAGYNPFETIIN